MTGVGASSVALALPLPTHPEVRAAHRPSDLILLRSPRRADPDDHRSDRPPPALVALSDFSPALRTSIVLAEDHRLPRPHRRRLGGSGAQHLGQSVGQRRHAGRLHDHDAAGLVDGDLARPAGGRSVAGQARQIAAARQIEARWSKAQIPEAYLKLRADARRAGRRAGGVAGAAGQVASGLDAAEAAILAALVRGPNAPREVVVRRGDALPTVQRIDCATLGRRRPVRFGWRCRTRAAARATERMRRTTPGRRCRAWQALPAPPGHWRTRRWTHRSSAWRCNTAAAPARRAEPAPCRGWCGRRARQRHRRGDRLSARRRGAVGRGGGGHGAGAAPAGRRSNPSSRDGLRAPPDHPGQPARGRADVAMAGGGVYAPQNYDRDFHGWVSARVALASSLNIRRCAWA